MTEADRVAEIAGKLTKAQSDWLAKICRTNGGGVRIRCRVLDSGEAVPANGALCKLYEKDLIQGKSGDWETVVHTRLGLDTYRAHLARGGR